MKYPDILLIALLIVLLTNFTKSDIAIYEESTDVKQISVKYEILRFRTEKLPNNSVSTFLNVSSEVAKISTASYECGLWLMLGDTVNAENPSVDEDDNLRNS